MIDLRQIINQGEKWQFLVYDNRAILELWKDGAIIANLVIPDRSLYYNLLMSLPQGLTNSEKMEKLRRMIELVGIAYDRYGFVTEEDYTELLNFVAGRG